MPDADSSPHFGHVCLQLPSECFSLGQPATASPLPLCFLYPLPFLQLYLQRPKAIPPDEKKKKHRGESHETPTLPWLTRLPFLFFLSFRPGIIIWKSTPTIKSFSRNLAPRSRKARRSRSGRGCAKARARAAYLLSSSFRSVICHVLGKTDAAAGGGKRRPPSTQSGRGVNKIAHLSRYFHLTQWG